ncbi:MAG TPA: DUF2247 family protein [Solirubrobacteraceae bacterium]|nr:DUF2247 family protein [Solirubrobacteraceae bacterium]
MEPRPLQYLPHPPLTREFVESRIELGWGDLAWLTANPWLPTQDIVDLADRLAEDDPDLRVEIALAADEPSALAAIVEREAALHGPSEAQVRDRWMRLAVLSLYEHRAEVSDPWPTLEAIWEAFDHAAALNRLVRWMPVAPGEAPGIDAMAERWRLFTEEKL